MFNRAHKSISRQRNFPDQIIEGLLYVADHARRDPLTRYAIDPDGTSLGRRLIASGTSEILRAEFFDPYLDAAVATMNCHKGCPGRTYICGWATS